MTETIKEILSEYSGVSIKEMTDETKLVSDLGLSSLDVVNIVVAFEEEFNIEIPDGEIKNFRTVKDIEVYLKNTVNNP